MNFFGDYHTHTTFSHGKGTVFENAQSAKSRGLKEIVISDHGYGHLLYGMKKKDFENLKLQIKDAEEKTGIKILLGVEANFTSINGDIDLDFASIENFDVITVGHHRFVKSKWKDKFKLFFPNIFGIKTKKQIMVNTATICLALEKYPIDILAHLKHGMAIDLEKVAKKAVETNTYIEINASKLIFTKQELDMMVGLGVKFVVSTDAHTPEKVGAFEKVQKFLQDNNVPLESVANINGVPEFKNRRK